LIAHWARSIELHHIIESKTLDKDGRHEDVPCASVTPGGTPTAAVAPGVRALPWQEFLEAL
jgi:hypothetical protein